MQFKRSRPELINKKGGIFLHDSARPYAIIITRRKFTKPANDIFQRHHVARTLSCVHIICFHTMTTKVLRRLNCGTYRKLEQVVDNNSHYVVRKYSLCREKKTLGNNLSMPNISPSKPKESHKTKCKLKVLLNAIKHFCHFHH